MRWKSSKLGSSSLQLPRRKDQKLNKSYGRRCSSSSKLSGLPNRLSQCRVANARDRSPEPGGPFDKRYERCARLLHLCFLKPSIAVRRKRPKEHCKMGEETANVNEIPHGRYIVPHICHQLPIRLEAAMEY